MLWVLFLARPWSIRTFILHQNKIEYVTYTKICFLIH